MLSSLDFFFFKRQGLTVDLHEAVGIMKVSCRRPFFSARLEGHGAQIPGLSPPGPSQKLLSAKIFSLPLTSIFSLPCATREAGASNSCWRLPRMHFKEENSRRRKAILSILLIFFFFSWWQLSQKLEPLEGKVVEIIQIDRCVSVSTWQPLIWHV